MKKRRMGDVTNDPRKKDDCLCLGHYMRGDCLLITWVVEGTIGGGRKRFRLVDKIKLEERLQKRMRGNWRRSRDRQ